jgi:hypothetical protein
MCQQIFFANYVLQSSMTKSGFTGRSRNRSKSNTPSKILNNGPILLTLGSLDSQTKDLVASEIHSPIEIPNFKRQTLFTSDEDCP